jgi:hypothetical protein
VISGFSSGAVESHPFAKGAKGWGTRQWFSDSHFRGPSGWKLWNPTPSTALRAISFGKLRARMGNRHPDRMVTKYMMNTMSALIAVLTYGIALGAAGLMLALRERGRRKHLHSAGEYMPSALIHGHLRPIPAKSWKCICKKPGNNKNVVQSC